MTQATGDQRIRDTKLTGTSDVAVAREALHTIENHYGTTVFAEGALWYYDDTQFHMFDPSTIQRCIYTLDGAVYVDASKSPRHLNISKGRAESIAGVMANIRSEVPDLFADPSRPPIIPCKNGVLVFDPATGDYEFSGHHRTHRNRHLLPGYWQPDLMDLLADLAGYRNTLLGTLIHGCFCDDAPEDRQQKVLALQEVAGSIAAGYATQLREPKAVIGVGPKGGNGKSQWSEVFAHMADKNATRSISPSKFGDDYHVMDLVGAVANIVNELPVRAVSGDALKQVISGEEVRGRQIYRAPSQFRPVAQHWYTCNEVPIFMGGIDGGFYRRLLFIPFDRVIPNDERVPHLGERIAREEPDLLLAFAVRGLQRLIRNRNFTVPASSSKTLEEAAAEADPVRAWARAWLHDATPGMGPGLLAAEAYEHFKIWYTRQGYKSEYRPSNTAFASTPIKRYPLALGKADPPSAQWMTAFGGW